MDKKISPLKDKPLRQAGQSVQEEIGNLIDDQIIPYLITAFFFVAIAGIEWVRLFQNSKPRPVLVTIIALMAAVVFLYKFIKFRKKVRYLKLGRDSEKIVGEFLELLRQDGCIVFHDIVGDKFNIDHVVLSPKGIYVIETKTYSKPNGKEARVHYDGAHLNIDGIGNKDDILVQIEAESNWLKETFKESTGKEFNIKPVVVFPGWYVESNNHNKHWVLNPKGLPKFIQNEKEKLNKEDVQLAAYHLSRYIRAL